MDIRIHPEAEREFYALDARESKAMKNALSKLATFGVELRFPHSSRVMGSDRLWELRPRAGRSRSRALYRVIGGEVVIGAFAPEFGVDPQAFRRAVARAEARLAEESGP